MKRVATMMLVGVCAISLAAWAQQTQPAKPAAKQPAKAAPQMPTPGPEHKRLAYWAGTWTATAEVKESLFGPAGTVTSTDTNEWLPGGFFLVTRSKEKGPMGDSQGMAFMGYDPEEKVYVYYAISSAGYSVHAKGTVTGKTWNWSSDSKMGGKPVKSKYTATEVSPSAYSYKFETSTDGGKTWTNVMEGKATKAGK